MAIAKNKAIVSGTKTFDPALPLRTAKHETFVQARIKKGLSLAKAFIEAYPNAQKWTDNALYPSASRLADKPKVRARYEWLMSKAADESIATPRERMQILTEIARGKITDYGEMGAAGFVPNIGPETKNARAVEEMTSRILVSGEGDGTGDAVIARVKLRDPLPAIKELNAMTNAYPESKGREGQTSPVIFNIVFPSGPRVPAPKIRTITMDQARESNRLPAKAGT